MILNRLVETPQGYWFCEAYPPATFIQARSGDGLSKSLRNTYNTALH
jgi:hypothetical protein